MEYIFSSTVVMKVLALLVGIIICFWGYRLQKLWIALFAFGAGFILVQRVAAYFTSNQGAIIGSAIVFGCIIAGLSFNIYLIGLFLAVAGSAIWVCCQLIANQWIGLFVGVMIGFFLGLYALRMNRPGVILITGVLGGLAVGSRAVHLLALIPATAAFAAGTDWLVFTIGAAAAVVGILYQFKSTINADPF